MKSLWKRIFHKYWWTLGWGNEPKLNQSHVTWSLCFSNINRPMIRWGRKEMGNDRFLDWICFDWGNGNSNPAFSIGYEWGDK